ncbi:MAG: YjbH domain-containing protein [Bacteroidales bacterium]|nr:YjbH domain-containing protein [Bacteroidales bacterium]
MLKTVTAQTEPVKESIACELIAEGFENVFVISKDSTLVIGYENRRFRFEPRGLVEALKIIERTTVNNFPLVIIISYQKIPMLYISLNLVDYRDFLTGQLSVDEFTEMINISMENDDFSALYGSVENNSQFKADFVILPQFRAQFGNFDQPVQSNINIIPEMNILLAKGLSLKTQVIVPVQNSFLLDNGESEVRPGIMAINQMLRLEDNLFLTASAGFFTMDRVGVNLEFKKYFADGKIAIGTNIGYTAFYTFIPKQIEYFEDDAYFTGLLSAEYRYQPYDLTGRIQFGNFLYNDPGVRFDILRQFGEVNIGFFCIVSQPSEFNGGFNFAIPLPPGKFMKFKYMRLRQADKFTWEYRAKGFVKNGTIYKTGNELIEIMLEYNPDFFLKRLNKELQ